MSAMTTEERNWSALAHASGALTMFFLPSLGFIAPMLIYLLKHEQSAAIRYHGRQAVYFQVAMSILVWIFGVIGSALSCFLVGFFMAIPAFLVWMAGVIVPILAAVKVNNGENDYSYPLTGSLIDKPRQLG